MVRNFPAAAAVKVSLLEISKIYFRPRHVTIKVSVIFVVNQ